MEDREHLTEFFNDWRTIPSDSIPQFLEELRKLLIGPLRTSYSGHADTETLMALTQYASLNNTRSDPS